MKNYSKENYESFEAFEKDFNDSMNVVKGLKVNCDKYGEGTITNAYVHCPDFESYSPYSVDELLCLYVEVEFECGSKTFVMPKAIDSGFLKVDEVTILALKEGLDILKDSTEARRADLDAMFAAEIEADRLEREQRQAKLKAEKEAAKFELRKEQALAKLNKLKPESAKKLFKDSPNSFYESLGWMAKHLKCIKPTMPDYMEPWFITNFGDVEERYVVDSKKKTSGGFAYQWSLGFKMTFDEEVSGPLAQKATSKNKKSIDNVAFVWDLIDNYGFKFGKIQDIDKILDEIPADRLDEFRRGYAL